jgi:ABC-type glycerol-3-phosphate transport system substrate-binding protein
MAISAPKNKFCKALKHLALGLLLACVGCGPKADPPLRITTGDSGPGLIPHRQILAKLEASRPGLRLQLEPVSGGDYYTRLLTELASDTPPDILQIGDDALGMFASRGCLLELPEPPANQFFPTLVAPGRSSGKLYALPKDYSTLAVYLNARLFREAGLAVPNGAWSLEEMLLLSRRLTTEKQFGVVLPGVKGATLEWLTMLYGGSLFDAEHETYLGAIDGPASRKALALMQSLYRDKITPLPSELGSYTGGIVDFEEGRAAMKIGGHWHLAALRDNPAVDLVVIRLPSYQGRRTNLLHWAGLAVASRSQRRSEALEVLQAYCGPTGSEAFSKWALPAVPAVAASSGLSQDPLEKVWLDELDHVKPRAYQADPFWAQVGGPAVSRLHEAVVVESGLDIERWSAQVASQAQALRVQRQRELP